MSETPSPSLIAALADEMARHRPFSLMRRADLEALVASADQTYHAPDEIVLEPSRGVIDRLWFVRRGAVAREATDQGALGYEAGELFPLGAWAAERPVVARYRAAGDLFCLVFPGDAVREATRASAPFADFVQRRVWSLLEESRRELLARSRADALAEQSLEMPLQQLVRYAPVGVPAQTPLGDALHLMHERRIGSVLVVDDAMRPQGIFTRHDVIDRVSLPQRPLATPIAEVMSSPVHTLPGTARAQEAAMLMARHGIRHVPVTEGERLVGIVSERDLFALQRLSIHHLTAEIGAAADVAACKLAAAGIRRFARQLASQGLGARALTELISHLNDRLTARLVVLIAREDGLDLNAACWLAFGSEGRGEQTIATDQDNGIAFVSSDPPADRPRWLALGARVNAALDECGYPLCKGGIMAGQAACCLSVDEWRERFTRWIGQGAPEDLLAASIFFDLRPIGGRLSLAEPLRATITAAARDAPRFLRLLAHNALERRAPINWVGAVETTRIDSRDTIDLKLQGTAIFVDAARLFSLVHGVEAVGTRERFEAVAPALRVEDPEAQAWCAGFEFLQMLRLRRQLDDNPDVVTAPNRIDVESLNEIDRRVLKESLRVARRLQQRIELDWPQ